MKYKVALHKPEEGCSVCIPGLPGCWSEGATEVEALANIEEAMREYLDVASELIQGDARLNVEEFRKLVSGSPTAQRSAWVERCGARRQLLSLFHAATLQLSQFPF